MSLPNQQMDLSSASVLTGRVPTNCVPCTRGQVSQHGNETARRSARPGTSNNLRRQSWMLGCRTLICMMGPGGLCS